MDPYTDETKQWLDKRFNKIDEDGIYIAHQPIYGYLNGHCGPGDYVTCYNRVYETMLALSHLRGFTSVLDVGAAEGFTANAAVHLFNTKVECCDLSKSACMRAEEIFSLHATQADIHHLPYKDGAFDVVICNETLEHLTDWKRGAQELIRVANKAIIISVPHESEQLIERNRISGEKHAHINRFDTDSFDDIASSSGLDIALVKPFQHKSTSRISWTILGTPKVHCSHSKYPPFAYSGYNCLLNILRNTLGNFLPVSLMRWDSGLVGKSIDDYGAIIFILTKSKNHFTTVPTCDISPQSIVDFSVPLYRLGCCSNEHGLR